MTKQERAIVLKAAEQVETGLQCFSCTAIDAAYFGTHVEQCESPLRIKYAEFYKMHSWLQTNGSVAQFFTALDSVKTNFVSDIKELRVLMLLTFAEVG